MPKNYKCKVDAITISKAQFDYTANKIQKEGLAEKVDVFSKIIGKLKKVL